MSRCSYAIAVSASHIGWKSARAALCAGVLASLCALIYIPAHAQKLAQVRSPGDGIRIHFNLPQSVSIRNQYANLRVFVTAFRHWSRRPGRQPCNLSLRLGDHFSMFYLMARSIEPTQNDECLRSGMNFILRDSISESDFVTARAANAEDTRTWTAPHPRHKGLANAAAERLAYLVIYQRDTPIHELYSVAEDAIVNLSFDAFIQWLRDNREQKLISFEVAESGAASITMPISLASPRVASGILFYDGERFEVPALIMVSLDPEYAARRLANNSVWRRFACNRADRSASTNSASADAIVDVECFSHSIFSTDSWLGLAIRKSKEF